MTTVTGDDGEDRITSGPCRKCMTEIPLQADRCRECGFEPRVGLIGKILVWVSIVWGSTFLVMALSSLIVIFDGFPVRDGLIAFAFLAFLSSIGFGYVARKWGVYEQKPAIQLHESLEDEDIDSVSVTEEWREAWKNGQERGDRYRDRIDHAPDWVFNAIIITGVMISLSVWVVGVLELETAMIVSIITGLAVLGLGVTIDVERTNRVHDTGFRWWFWGVLAMIPLIGWIPAIGWMVRRRRSLRTLT